VSEEEKEQQAEAWRRAQEGEAKRQKAEAAQPSRQEEWQQEDEWQQATDKATGESMCTVYIYSSGMRTHT
jgi:hypothetical protein